MSFDPNPSCGNEDCPCGKPGAVCEEYMPFFSGYCARCGWERPDHDQ